MSHKHNKKYFYILNENCGSFQICDSITIVAVKSIFQFKQKWVILFSSFQSYSILNVYDCECTW